MDYIEIDGHKLHLFRAGDEIKPKLVHTAGTIACPILMFVSDGKQVSSGWIEHERAFAEQTNAKTIYLNCGHYIHYYESESISREIRDFIKQVLG